MGVKIERNLNVGGWVPSDVNLSVANFPPSQSSQGTPPVSNYVRGRESLCVRERERVSVRDCACVCVYERVCV